jgi:GTP cyclohydrolase I
MSVLNVSRRIARGMTAQLDLLERLRQEIVAAAARLLQPRGVLVPIRVVADRQKRARRHD